jgi:hypothetical protein
MQSVVSSTSTFLIHSTCTECEWHKETTAKQLMGSTGPHSDGKTTNELKPLKRLCMTNHTGDIRQRSFPSGDQNSEGESAETTDLENNSESP